MNGDGLVHALAQFVKRLRGFQETVQRLEVYAAIHFLGKLLHLFLEIMQIAIRQQTCAADGLQTNHESLIMHARNRLGQLEAPVHRAACNLKTAVAVTRQARQALQFFGLIQSHIGQIIKTFVKPRQLCACQAIQFHQKAA